MTVASGGSIGAGLVLSGGTATLDTGAVDQDAVVRYAGSGGLLVIASGGGFQGEIGGLGAGDKVDVGGFAYGSGAETLAFAPAAGGLGGQLTLSSAGHAQTLTLLGAYATSDFTLATDNHGGTIIACVSSGGFAAGNAGAALASAATLAGAAQLAAAMAAFTTAAPGSAPALAATSASHAPLLAQGH
jgi:hypothetical protein